MDRCVYEFGLKITVTSDSSCHTPYQHLLYVSQALLDLGASTNYKDSRGLTPLYYSILYSKNPNIAEALLHERAFIGSQDEQGWYEIHQVQMFTHLSEIYRDILVT